MSTGAIVGTVEWGLARLLNRRILDGVPAIATGVGIPALVGGVIIDRKNRWRGAAISVLATLPRIILSGSWRRDLSTDEEYDQKNGESERATIAGSERRGGAKATPDSQLTQSFYLNLKRPKYPSVNQLNDSTPDHKLYLRLWSGVFRDIGPKALAVFSAPSLSTKVVRKRLSERSDGYP